MKFLVIPMRIDACKVAFLTKYFKTLAFPVINEAIRHSNSNCIHLSTSYMQPDCYIAVYLAL